MNKKTLIFDASVIAENLSIGSGRSGIYFTAFNMLKYLIKSNKFDVSLFVNNVYDDKFDSFISKHFGNNIRIYFGNKYGVTIAKLSILDKKLRAHKYNIIKMLLNICIRKPLKFLGNCSNIPHFDVALSPFCILPNNIYATHKYVFLHDTIPLLFPQYYPQMQIKQYWFYDLIKQIKSGQNYKYFANSESTKNDFVKFLGVNPDNITVTHLAAGDMFYHEYDNSKIQKIRNKYNIPDGKKYLLSLCTLEPRKNLIRAVRCFIKFIQKNNINDMVFVLGGGYWDDFIGKLETEISDLGKYRNTIIRAGYIDDNDLAALYSGAEWFVYTSQYEGFGLPPLEAMKCGCPVITSNNSSLPEVVGDAGIMIDYDNDQQHIAAYEKYYFDKKYRNKMANRGQKHSQQFSWENNLNTITTQIQKDFQC